MDMDRLLDEACNKIWTDPTVTDKSAVALHLLIKGIELLKKGASPVHHGSGYFVLKDDMDTLAALAEAMKAA